MLTDQRAPQTERLARRAAPAADRPGRPGRRANGPQRCLVAGLVALGGYLTARFLGRFAGSPLENATLLRRAEELAGIGVEGELQRAALAHAPWLISAANVLYTFAYWPVLVATLVWTWRHDRRRHQLLRTTMLGTALVGFVVQATFPVTPPRLLPGFTDTIAGHPLLRRLAHPAPLINEHAAFPSFHVGWLALSLRLALPAARPAPARWLYGVAVGAMSVAVVLTANHYLLDIVGGVGLAALGARYAERTSIERPGSS